MKSRRILKASILITTATCTALGHMAMNGSAAVASPAGQWHKGFDIVNGWVCDFEGCGGAQICCDPGEEYPTIDGTAIGIGRG